MVKDEPIGSLVFQHHSRPAAFAPAQVDFAAGLTTSVSLAVENARLYAEQRNIADTLQGALLTMPKQLEGIELGHLYRSATVETAEVGGDFYDVFELGDGRIGLVIGDVSGKGLEAATLTSLVKNTIKAYAHIEASPASVLAKTNNIVSVESAPSVFVTVFLGVLNAASGSLIYCGAGHPPGAVRRSDGECFFLRTDSPAVGLLPGFDFHDHSERLDQGDLLFLYTDGLTEARRGRRFFGDDRLLSVLCDLKSSQPAQAIDTVFDEVRRFTGGTLSDDIALLAISPKL